MWGWAARILMGGLQVRVAGHKRAEVQSRTRGPTRNPPDPTPAVSFCLGHLMMMWRTKVKPYDLVDVVFRYSQELSFPLLQRGRTEQNICSCLSLSAACGGSAMEASPFGSSVYSPPSPLSFSSSTAQSLLFLRRRDGGLGLGLKFKPPRSRSLSVRATSNGDSGPLSLLSPSLSPALSMFFLCSSIEESSTHYGSRE